MTGLSLDETRALASLATIAGYKVLVEKVVKSKVETVITKLKLAKGRDDRADAGTEFAIWDDVLTTLREIPAQAVEELKTEGDTIYG